MNVVLINSEYSEKQATSALIEFSQEKDDDKQINFDIELKKWMKIPQKKEISVTKTEQSPVKKPSRPSTASGSRPKSAKSDYQFQKQDFHGKAVLVKKVSIDAPLVPIGFNFFQGPNLYKLKKRSNSLRIDNENFHVDLNKSKAKRVYTKFSKNQMNTLTFKQKFKREKFYCLDVQNFSKFVIKF